MTTIDHWRPIEPGSRLVKVYAWEHMLRIPHPKWLHRYGLICPWCYDDSVNHSTDLQLERQIEDAWEERQREIFDLNRLLDADDPFAQERSEDLEEVIDAPIVEVERECQGCEEFFQIPEHLANRFQELEMPLLCPRCLGC